MTYDFLVVGAGFAGSVLARQLAEADKSVLLVEQRSELGGNCYDYQDKAEIFVHKYGPHIFHTDNQEVWDYLCQFTRWIPYQHHVLANYNGQILTLPVNFNTIKELFSPEQADIIIEKLQDDFGQEARVPILKLRQSNDQDLKQLAEVVYEKVYLNYTKKQWGLSPQELDPQVTARVPLWTDQDNRYFKDKFQGIPQDGYSKIFARLLDHPKIKVVLGKDYKDLLGEVEYNQMIYTGPIDYYFDYKHGRLAYRSLRFEFKTLEEAEFQPVAVVNYPGKEPFTRITEFKHFSDQEVNQTTILYEYPQEHEPGQNIACYPIPQDNNFEQYQKYQAEAAKLKNLVFVGRLAEYKYYNMDGVVARALEVAKELLK